MGKKHWDIETFRKSWKKVVQLKHDSPDYQKISDTANKRYQGEGWSSGHYLVHQR